MLINSLHFYSQDMSTETKEQDSKRLSIVQYYLDNGIKYVCFDWDFTVLAIHTSRILLPFVSGRPSIDYLKWTEASGMDLTAYVKSLPSVDQYANGELFKQVVLQCIENGIAVHIMSFGYRALICGYVEALFGKDQKIFSDANVHTPSNFGINDFCSALGNKNQMLEKLGLADTDKSAVIFYDDDVRNINAAMEDGFKNSVCVPASRGLSEENLYFPFIARTTDNCKIA